MSEKEKMNRFFSTALPCERSEDINEAVCNYSPTDEKRICKLQDKCRKKNCKFEHAPLTKGAFFVVDVLFFVIKPDGIFRLYNGSSAS